MEGGVRGQARSRWSESVRDHLETLATAVSLDRAPLTPQELEAALTSRLVDADRIHATDLGFDDATPFIDGVHEVLTLDLPSAVVALPDARVDSIGRRLPRLVDIGRGNLHRRLERTTVEVERAGEPTGRVWTITSDSPYTASFARLARRVQCLSVTSPDGILSVEPTPFLQDVLDRGRPGGR